MKKHKYRYSRLLAFVFALLFVTASVNAQTCMATNAEDSMNPPAGWVVNGLKPSAGSPIAGDSSYVSEGFNYLKSYTIASPVITGDIAFTDQFVVDFKWRVSQPYWSMYSSFTINLYVKNMATGTSYLIKSENKTSANYTTQTFTLNGHPRTATGFSQGFVAHQFIIEFKANSRSTRPENWVKVDDINICNTFTQPPLAGGGSTPPDIHLSLASYTQDDVTKRVLGSIDINKGPASPCSDPNSPNCFSQHDVKVFRHKYQVADDEYVETQMVGTWAIPASTSSSVYTIHNQLLSDTAYYYLYFVSDEPSYNAKNQPFPKVLYVEPQPEPQPSYTHLEPSNYYIDWSLSSGVQGVCVIGSVRVARTQQAANDAYAAGHTSTVRFYVQTDNGMDQEYEVSFTPGDVYSNTVVVDHSSGGYCTGIVNEAITGVW